MARLAVRAKTEPDDRFHRFFPLIPERARDSRNMVRKAASWAVRQMGKRCRDLHSMALACALHMSASDDPGCAWAGRDALRELSDPRVAARLKR